MSRNVKVVFMISVILLISVVVSFISFIELTGRSDRIFPGVCLKGINLGNMTKNQAAAAIEDYIGSLEDKYITVHFNGNRGSGKIRALDTGLQADTDNMLQAAWLVGRSGTYLQQWQERKASADNGREIPLEVSFSKDKVRNIFNHITSELRLPASDARLIITPQETIEIVEATTGIEIDFEGAYSQLEPIFRDDLVPEINVNFLEVAPSKTTDDITNLRINGILAEFTTWFNAENNNRSENVRVAAMALNGRMIKQGEVFSFNEVVGPRSQEAGYKNAKIIQNNEFIDGLGGGVCQVSSTLYNALLRAGIDIQERHNHSLVVTYVPMGQDAAVVYGAKDLKFTNNLPCALIIKTSTTKNTVTIKLFGDTSQKKSVKIINTVIKEYPFKIVYKNDLTQSKGKQVVVNKGQNGYRVVSKLMVNDGGTFKEFKQLAPSYYKPLDQVVNVGVKPVQPQPPKDTDSPEMPDFPDIPDSSEMLDSQEEVNPPEETSIPGYNPDYYQLPVTIPPKP
ncbi:VanW family protein [Phosphitispora sp. TUW77]|uniref:VanW family protein n=1 Tax=Phosphitispora sp. TUW77 TaxID=3152361 RepID=UPI003AB8C163